MIMWIAQKGLQSRNSVPHRKKTRHSAALAFQAFCVPWVSSLVDHTVNLKKIFYFYPSLKQIRSFRIPEHSDHEVWEYPGGNQRFWTFPNQHHHPAVHPSYSSAVSLPAEQLHRWFASSPLWYQQTGWRRTLQEFNLGAEADGQRARARRWKPQILRDVCRASVSALSQRLQQRWPANSWVSERMGVWQLHLHFHPGNRGTNFLHSVLIPPDFDTVLLHMFMTFCMYTWVQPYIWKDRYLIR